MKSKENKVLELFLNSPKHWRFEEIIDKAKITRPQLSRWLKIFQKQEIINRIKEKGKMPYYVQNSSSQKFMTRKKLFAMNIMAESGLIDHLSSLPKAKVVILFGSFSRQDWNQNSDIDLFIYGSDQEFEQGNYEHKLRREIQVHKASNNKELKKIDKLLPYIISGDFIKGSIEDLGVEIHAKA